MATDTATAAGEDDAATVEVEGNAAAAQLPPEEEK